jgi:hypothetical protein
MTKLALGRRVIGMDSLDSSAEFLKERKTLNLETNGTASESP